MMISILTMTLRTLVLSICIPVSIANGGAVASLDWFTSWGNNDPLIDMYGQNALCLESKSYFVNISDARFKTCPKAPCRYQTWKETHYDDPKYLDNELYAIKRIPAKDHKHYMYVPNHNVQRSDGKYNPTKISSEGKVYPRKVVGK
jgi:hypothetical protein